MTDDPTEPSLATAAAEPQEDLFYLDSVLVTAGVVNLNDDYFPPTDAWAARHTPEDKPFNWEHDQTDVIGHMKSAWAVDPAGARLPDDTPAEDLPGKFHIATSGVLYKRNRNPDRQKRIDQTLAEIAAGEWFVSMECLFAGFDYVLVPKDEATGAWDAANAKVVARGDKTRFLTKHLRAYGGTGEWNGHKVGRALKDVLFHGVGLVRQPANPESVILSTAGKIAGGDPPVVYQPHSETSTEETMTNEVDTLKAELAKAQAALKARDEAAAADLVKAKEAAEAALKTAQDRLAEALAGKAAAETLAKDLTDKLGAAQAGLKEAETKLAEQAAEARLKARADRIKEVYGVDEAKAAALLDSGLADIADDKFDALMKSQAEYLDEKTKEYQAKAKPAPGETKESGLPAPMGGGSKPVKGKGAAASAALAGAADQPAPPLAVAATPDNPVAELARDLAAFLTPAGEASK